jgi:hypothetical protein
VGNALQLHVGPFGRAVVKQQRGAVLSHQKLLEAEDLPPVPERALGQEPQLGQRVDHHAPRLEPLDGVERLACRRVQLDFRRVVHREVVLAVDPELVGKQLEDLNAVERPAMRLGIGHQLAAGLGQRHVQARFAAACPVDQVLQSEGGLAGARVAVQKVEAAGDQPAMQNFV